MILVEKQQIQEAVADVALNPPHCSSSKSKVKANPSATSTGQTARPGPSRTRKTQAASGMAGTLQAWVFDGLLNAFVGNRI